MLVDKQSAETSVALQIMSNFNCVDVTCCGVLSHSAGLRPRCGRMLRTRKALTCELSVATDRSARDRCRGVRGRTVPAGRPAPGPGAGVGHPRHTNGTRAGRNAGCSVGGSRFGRNGGGL